MLTTSLLQNLKSFLQKYICQENHQKMAHNFTFSKKNCSLLFCLKNSKFSQKKYLAYFTYSISNGRKTLTIDEKLLGCHLKPLKNILAISKIYLPLTCSKVTDGVKVKLDQPGFYRSISSVYSTLFHFQRQLTNSYRHLCLKI